MWNDITKPLADNGLEAARRYLTKVKGVNQARAVFHDGNFTGVLDLQAAFHLYIVAHGTSDVAGMNSGIKGAKTWSAIKLAQELIGKGLPGDREARIKLILCHSAEDIIDRVLMPVPPKGLLQQIAEKIKPPDPVEPTPPAFIGIFAQNLARALAALGSGRNDFKNVYVGGFHGPVNWYHDMHERQIVKGDPPERVRVSRVYYRCDADGTPATNEQNLSGVRQLSEKHARGGSKWIREVPAGEALKCAYFPFDLAPG